MLVDDFLFTETTCQVYKLIQLPQQQSYIVKLQRFVLIESMVKKSVLALLLFTLFTFGSASNAFANLIADLDRCDPTNIGNKDIACNPQTTGKTNGFATNFNDNVYFCSQWNHKAMSLSTCFVAINGVCGMHKDWCNKCVQIVNSQGQSEVCKVIDYCDPSNCDFRDPGHLDILANDGKSHYKFVDKGTNVTPCKEQGAQPAIRWSWVNCNSGEPEIFA